ncbi:DUF4124 domain-containing protein [Halopseudomonas salina]|uniref:DUF4124 domain-containing protein n=1 Tax=Halopseudomonas salina TaxID=1323744 RepID=A0ABQ1PDG2_9GAMM|nr:DUF4124 domain-containing protein [Halopseudomonas salina]GGC95088.1 hypothetical protein GCM10007418_13350 [Halopseudomonas salina]
MLRSFCLIVVATVGLSLPAQAQLYRYLDENGVTVLDSRVPAEYVKHGYEVLDSHGRVVDTVAAAPTPKELAEVRAARAEQERQLQEDKTLLRLYSSVPDLKRARGRQLEQIENLIAATRTNIAVLQGQREELQSRAAAQQRAGREVEESILLEITHVDAEMDRLERLIAAKQQEIEAVHATFEQRRARLEQLLKR